MLRLILYLVLAILNQLGSLSQEQETTADASAVLAGKVDTGRVAVTKTSVQNEVLKENSELNPECKSYDVY